MASRELTFEEESAIYEQEVLELEKHYYSNDIPLDYIRDIVNRGLRIIKKAEILRAEKRAVLYFCDRRACNQCNPECMHTNDISHAKDFELLHDVFIEQ